MGVDDLLQKHGLLESDIHVLGERVKTVNLQATKFVEGDFSEVGGQEMKKKLEWKDMKIGFNKKKQVKNKDLADVSGTIIFKTRLSSYPLFP